MSIDYKHDTICAPATPPGTGAIAIIRVSGPGAIEITEKIFRPVKKGKSLSSFANQTVHRGQIFQDKAAIDEVLVSLFRAPNSYTGEDIIEIYCHGSQYIQQKIMELLTNNGARVANPGEFTLRAFLNGKMDLSQAEAVADLIASTSENSHSMAYKQMRGHFSWRIEELRRQLVDFATMIELELDFSEEDVEFASREKLMQLLQMIDKELHELIESFAFGNVLKTGIPVAIIGKPNVGKSTLLNAIFNEEKAIVSETPGTTRDAIEDTIILDGISFRFIDTAGLRDSEDEIENMGVEKTYQKINQASIILYLFDASNTTIDEINETIEEFCELIDNKSKKMILIANKIDLMVEMPKNFRNLVDMETIFVSAKRKENINMITGRLLETFKKELPAGEDIIVSNSRHHQALKKTQELIKSLQKGIEEKLSGDLLSSDLRTALYHLGTITGEVTSEEILDNIFEKFCIGK